MKITDEMTDEQKEAIRAKRRESQRKWIAANKDKVAMYNKRKRERDPEKYRKKWTERYWKHREELKAKARERYRAKHPGMKPLEPMKRPEPVPESVQKPKMVHRPHPKKYHEFDRDKVRVSNLTKSERAKLKELKNKLVGLDRLWNIRRIDLETYIRERSLVLAKIAKFDKQYSSDE